MSKRRATDAKTKAARKDWRITRGGVKLGRLIKRLGMNETEFSKGAGVERITLHRVISGERWQRIDVNFVLAVCAFGKNGLVVEDFAAMTAVPPEEVEDEPAAGRRKTGTDG